ncbi:MAG TPA: pyridoxine 5'-phosphate synthase [bacterium]|nr:pyridoxine 5'-phosphate synthase [bacterium]
MAELCVNIDHVATMRQARRTFEPDPVFAATIVHLAGAHGITIHLREDRRHINDRDLHLIREVCQIKLNLEMAATEEMTKTACEVIPDQITLVPEGRQEITTEGGLDVDTDQGSVRRAVEAAKDAGIETSLFIDPVKKQIDASKKIGADAVEIHTGSYANARGLPQQAHELEIVAEACAYADNIGLDVYAGHGLTYYNVVPVAGIGDIQELNIGHSIIARAVLVGLDRAIREMLALIKGARSTPS